MENETNTATPVDPTALVAAADVCARVANEIGAEMQDLYGWELQLRTMEWVALHSAAEYLRQKMES